jgi:glycosyltransferase involved in cell wall biosynthesis
MKILHIITDLDKGGAEFALFRLLKFARENDKINEHIVISLTPNGYFEDQILKLGYLAISLDFRSKKFYSIKKLFLIINNERPEIIQTWMYHSDLIGGVIGRVLGIKRIFWGIHHSNLSLKANKLTTYLLFKLLSKISYSLPYKIIACSKISIEVHKKLGYKDLFVYSPLGYDFNEFEFNEEKRLSFRNYWSLGSDDFLAGIVSRWDSQKDIHNLISAISIVQRRNYSIKYVIVGKNLDYDNIDFVNLINKFNIDRRSFSKCSSRGDVV